MDETLESWNEKIKNWKNLCDEVIEDPSPSNLEMLSKAANKVMPGILQYEKYAAWKANEMKALPITDDDSLLEKPQERLLEFWTWYVLRSADIVLQDLRKHREESTPAITITFQGTEEEAKRYSKKFSEDKLITKDDLSIKVDAIRIGPPAMSSFICRPYSEVGKQFIIGLGQKIESQKLGKVRLKASSQHKIREIQNE